jgi:hypothetical protein
MGIHLRQIALVASRLAPVVDDLQAVFGIEVCHVDPGLAIWGLENALLPVGRNFIEVVAPTEAGTAAGRYIERRHGDGGSMVICQTDSRDTQKACRERAAALNVRVAYESDERDGFNLMQLHPRDLEAAFFEIDWDADGDFTGRWEPAGGTGWVRHVRTGRVQDIAGVELQCEDPPSLAKKWARIAGVAADLRSGHPQVALDNATLRFVEIADGRGPGLGGIDLVVSDRAAILNDAKSRGCHVSENLVMVCGTRFYLA